VFFGVVFFEQAMEIAASEAESADGGVAWVVGSGHPGPELGIDIKGGFTRCQRTGGALDLDGGRKYLWWSAKATFMRPATPAEALVWPIWDLTDPRAHQGSTLSGLE
jgi:hypothetical protein